MMMLGLTLGAWDTQSTSHWSDAPAAAFAALFSLLSGPSEPYLPRFGASAIGEANEFYMVAVTTFILIATLYFLQKWWTNYR